MRPFVAVASAFFLMPLLAGVPAQAALTVAESFKSTANKDSSDMVWNTALGELHPPLVVKSYNDDGTVADFNFSVGDGRHGDFISAADYAALSCASVSGSVIVIDTDQCSNLQFKNFRLLSGWTLRPKGSMPLVIRSLSDVWVEGTIDCSGGDGEDGDASVAAASAGGTGRCGGGNGGASVLPGVAAGAENTGEGGGSLVTGGDGGGLQGASGGEGGGGGGAYVKDFDNPGDSPDGTDGVDTGGVGVGNVGTNYRDDDFMDDLSGAGSGGGGGSGFDLGTPSENSRGGGGGAGGGNIQIYAVGDVTVDGSILANGGKGGSVTSTYLAGGGGGGGGGSILIMTVGEIENDGVISAANGLGGTAVSSANGGDGYWGRTWVVEKDGYAGGGNVESPETTLSSPGNVRYETGLTYTVTSRPIDLGNSAPEILNAEATVQDIGSSTLNFQVAFGEFADDAALNSFAAVSSYAGQKVGPYARFQISLDNLNATVPARVTMVEFEFDGHVQEEFNFVGACGGIAGAGLGLGLGGVGGGGSGNGFTGGVAMASWLALLLLPFGFLLGLRLKGTRLFAR